MSVGSESDSSEWEDDPEFIHGKFNLYLKILAKFIHDKFIL